MYFVLFKTVWACALRTVDKMHVFTNWDADLAWKAVWRDPYACIDLRRTLGGCKDLSVRILLQVQSFYSVHNKIKRFQCAVPAGSLLGFSSRLGLRVFGIVLWRPWTCFQHLPKKWSCCPSRLHPKLSFLSVSTLEWSQYVISAPSKIWGLCSILVSEGTLASYMAEFL